MVTVDWDRVSHGVKRERERMIWRPYGIPTILDLEHSAFHDAPISVPWDIPDRLVVSVAITGAFFRHDQNPHQALSADAILQSARDVAAAGASTVHIHVRDDEGYNTLSLERFEAVINPLHQDFPGLVVDGCLVPALEGEWEEMKRVLESGLLDAAPVNAAATYVGDSLFVKPAPVLMEKTRLIAEAGVKPEIAVYTDSDVSNADRFLLRSGLVSTPAAWIVLPGLPGGSPMDNPRQMVDGLTRTVAAIRDVDPDGLILVCVAGRASIARRHARRRDGAAHPRGHGRHLLEVAAPRRPHRVQPRGTAARPTSRRGCRPAGRHATGVPQHARTGLQRRRDP